jgi:hypothetical protein
MMYFFLFLLFIYYYYYYYFWFCFYTDYDGPHHAMVDGRGCGWMCIRMDGC